jgi:hypothetical protein
METAEPSLDDNTGDEIQTILTDIAEGKRLTPGS